MLVFVVGGVQDRSRSEIQAGIVNLGFEIDALHSLGLDLLGEIAVVMTSDSFLRDNLQHFAELPPVETIAVKICKFATSPTCYNMDLEDQETPSLELIRLFVKNFQQGELTFVPRSEEEDFADDTGVPSKLVVSSALRVSAVLMRCKRLNTKARSLRSWANLCPLVPMRHRLIYASNLCIAASSNTACPSMGPLMRPVIRYYSIRPGAVDGIPRISRIGPSTGTRL